MWDYVLENNMYMYNKHCDWLILVQDQSTHKNIFPP